MPKLKLKTTLHREDIKGARTYCVVREASKVFNSKNNIPVIGTLDNFKVEGVLVAHGDGSHWFSIKKEWREAIGKTIGDSVILELENAPAKTTKSKK